MWQLIIMSWFGGSVDGYVFTNMEFTSDKNAEQAKEEILKVWDGRYKPLILIVKK